MTAPNEAAAEAQQSLKLLIKGFAGFDMRLLEGVVKLSKRRNPSLEVITDPSTSAVDVILIDGKDADATAWAQEKQKWLARQPVLWVDAKQEIPHGHTGIVRPVQWTNLPVILSRTIDDATHEAGDDDDADLHYDMAAGQAAPSAPAPAAAPAAVPTPAATPAPAAAQAPAPSAAAQPTPEKQVADSALQPLLDRQRGIPVLVVDDSVAVRKHLSHVLKSYGYDVTTAESGEAGVMEAGNSNFACILMDVLMPGIDGYDACRRIKSAGKNAPPIVMLTSKSSPFDKIRGKMAGCDAYLTKPVSKSHLMEVLAQNAHKNSVANAT